MAITLLSQPPAYSPVYSPAWWTASSSQVAQPNFKYYVVFTDLITSATLTKKYDKRPSDNKLVFDSNFFAELYTEPYVPNNVYGFQRCTDGIRKIRVNIGEYYGTTPVVYTGSNVEYIVWNGVLTELEYPDYLITDYIYKNSTSNYKYLDTNVNTSGNYRPDGITYSGKSHFIYCLSSEATDIELLRINTYNAAGTLLGQYDIQNPYAPGTTYTDKYVCCDVGHKGLSAISSPADYSVITGSAPIITSSVAYYDVIDGYLAPPVTARKTYQRIYIGCEPKNTVYALHYWSKTGKFNTINFPKLSSVNKTSEKLTFNQNPYELTADVYSYSKFTAQERVLNASTQERITLQTDWLTFEQITEYAEIIDGPLCYLDYGPTTGLIPVIVETNTYAEFYHPNTRIPAFQITVRKGITNSKQRG
jgi:hypothetical protein